MEMLIVIDVAAIRQAAAYYAGHEEKILGALSDAIENGQQVEADGLRQALDGFLAARRRLYDAVRSDTISMSALCLSGDDLGRALIDIDAQHNPPA